MVGAAQYPNLTEEDPGLATSPETSESTAGGGIESAVFLLRQLATRVGERDTAIAHGFQEISDGMELARGIQDLQALKAEFRRCLNDFREESERRQAEMESAVQDLRKQSKRGRGSKDPEGENCDPVTGLPLAEAAQAAMERLAATGKHIYTVTMVLNRMEPINARFGNQVGDQVMRAFKTGIEKQLLPGDLLFRWNGPVLVALMERAESLDRFRATVRRMLDAPREQEFDIGGRVVLIPISAAWSAFALVRPVAIVLKHVQAFIEGQGSRDFA
jgi:GGDEF domain-containing protein